MVGLGRRGSIQWELRVYVADKFLYHPIVLLKGCY